MATAAHGTYSKQNLVLIFWIGVLTGALIVGLVFLYRVINDDNYKASLLKISAPTTTKTLTVPKTTLNKTTTTTTLNGATIMDPSVTTSMGDPGGGL